MICPSHSPITEINTGLFQNGLGLKLIHLLKANEVTWSGHIFTQPITNTSLTGGGGGGGTAILYWTYHAELTNDPRLGANQKMNDSEAACCGAEALGLRLGTTGCATGKQ